MKKINVFGFGLGIACMAVVASLTGCDKILKGEKAPVPLNLAAEKKTAEELVAWVKSVKGNSGKDETMTDLQRKQAFEKKLKGRMVIFKGEVREIGTTGLIDEPYVSLKVGKIDAFFNLNIKFILPEKAKSKVAAWKKGETHVLRGRIEREALFTDDAECEDSEIVADSYYK